MRLIFRVSMLVLLSACASTPPVPKNNNAPEIQDAALSIYYAESCVRKGYVQNTNVMAGAINIAKRTTALNPALAIQTIDDARYNRPDGLSQGDCRLLELKAAQVVQENSIAAYQAALNQQRQAENSARALQKSQNIQRSMTQYQPRTVQCQHLEWGNMTSCSAY